MQTPTLSPSASDRRFASDWEVRKNSKQSKAFLHSQLFRHSSPNLRRPRLSVKTFRSAGVTIIARELGNRWGVRHHIRADNSGARWLTDAMGELEEIDDEVAEEALPELSADTKKHARRIVFALTKQPIAPTVYPTTDGEIALYFKSSVAASSVLILVGNNGQAACFSYINGKNRRARYDDASDLPDEFVKAQIQALKEPAFL